MNSEHIPQVDENPPVYVPPTGSKIGVGIRQACQIKVSDPTVNSVDLAQAPPPGELPDPNLRISGKMTTTVDIGGNGVGKFNVLYIYPTGTTPQPDVARSIVAKSGGAEIPGGSVTYDFVVRDAFATVTPGSAEYAVYGGDALSVLLHVINGEDDAVGGAAVRVSCSDGNVRFYDPAGDDETRETSQNGSMIYYADFTTGNLAGTPGFGMAKAEFTAKNTGIFDILVEVPDYYKTRQFTLVVADDQIVPGALPPPRYSFASTLNLDGPATTFVRLTQAPKDVAADAKVVLVVNGNPVSPFDLTVQQFVSVGYELPKRWFTQKTIDGVDPNGKALVYYMVQSLDDDVNHTRSYITKFNTVGTVANRPDPNVGKRMLPMPIVSGAIVVNRSVIEPGTLPVEIDFTGSGVAAGLNGFVTVYANGYSASTSTIIDNVQTITQPFTTQAGKMIVKVDASLLWGFGNSATGQPSKLLIDYYVMLSQPVRLLDEPATSEIEDPKERELGKGYSQYLANGWTLATPDTSI
jgi:hypothetical protein